MESTAFFVVAEGLANALKYSQAERLWVRLAGRGGSLQVEVGDDGVGGASTAAGTGLRGLGDRVDVLGGRLIINSQPGRGTTLIAELPCGR